MQQFADSKTDVPAQRQKNGAGIREKIIQEAIRLFGDRGYEGAALRDVASACRIPLSTLCHHFASKQSLREAASGRAIELGAAMISGSVAGNGNPLQRLKQYIINLVELLDSNAPEIKLVDREFQLLDQEFVRDALAKSILDRPAPLTAVITDLDAEILHRIPAKRLGDMLSAMIYGLMKLRPLHHYETGAAHVTKEAIIGDVTLMFTHAINYTVPNAKGEGSRDYFVALGEFVHLFSAVEELMHILLMQSAQVSHGTATVLFSGLDVGEIRNRVAQLSKSYGSRASIYLASALEQFLRIEDARNKILHPTARYDNIQDVVLSQDVAKSGHVSPFSASLKIFRDMTCDLQSMRCGLLLKVAEEVTIDRHIKREMQRAAKAPWRFKGFVTAEFEDAS